MTLARLSTLQTVLTTGYRLYVKILSRVGPLLRQPRYFLLVVFGGDTLAAYFRFGSLWALRSSYNSWNSIVRKLCTATIENRDHVIKESFNV